MHHFESCYCRHLRSAILSLHANEGAKNVCIIPISFVSDHVETLGEINHEAREAAEKLGVERFEMSAGLNASPKFIEALADLVSRAVGQELNRSDRTDCLVAAD